MKQKIKKCYIAHPFNSRGYIRSWQLRIQKGLNIKFINPFYPKRVYEKYNKEDMSCNNYYKILDYKSIVNEDIKLIDKADMLLGIVDGEVSYGTIMEIVYAYIKNKKVYLIITNKHDKHPWFKYHANKIFTRKKQFEKWIMKQTT